jgi:hypothetical protein
VLPPLDRVELRKIERMALSIIPASGFAQEFVSIKYRSLTDTLFQSGAVCHQLTDEYRTIVGATTTWFEDQVRKSANENRLMEHEYCKIHFREYPSLQERVRKSAEALSRLRLTVSVGIVEVLEGIVETSKVSVRDLADLVKEDYLRPRASARAKIDSLLVYSTRTQADYHKLQEKGSAVLRTGADIRALLLGLSNLVVPGGPDFLALAHATKAHNLAVSQTAHFARSCFLDSREFRDPLKASNAHNLNRALQARSPDRKQAWQLVEAMVLNKPLKRVIDRKQKSVAVAIDAQYMKWRKAPKAATGVSSIRYLRQLDVMAPFETLVFMLRYLVHELWYLNLSMQGEFGPLWDEIPAPILIPFNHKMHQLTTKFRELQKDFLYEMREYRHINWIRLRIEEKLQQLGLPNEMQEKGLFVVSKPLSQDHPRFLRYIRSLHSLSYDTWFINRVLATIHSEQREGALAFWVELMKKVHERERERLNPSGPQDLGSEVVAVALKKRRRRRLRSAPKTVARTHDKTKARPPQVQPSQMTEKDQHNNSDPHKNSSDNAQMPASSESGQTNETVPVETAMSRLMRPFWSQQKTDSKQTPQNKSSLDAAVPRSDKWTAASRPPTSAEESTKSAKKPWSANSASSKFYSPAERKRPSTVKSSAATETTQTMAGITSKEQQRIAALEATVKQLQAQMKNLKVKKESPPAPVPQRKTVDRRTFRSHSRRGSRRSYCTDSRFTHVSARDCSDEPFSDQSFAVHVSSVTTIEDDPARSTENEFLPDQTSSSELNVKGDGKVTPSFWSHSHQRAPDGQKLIVHYCRSLESTEEVAKHFLNSKVIGFDMEWKAQVFASDSIQNNLSLIQIANEERIALFQIALFKPARNLEDFVAPSLRRILESPDITKVGVAIKADSTRLRKYLGIEARSIFELSHLFKLVKHGQANPKLVNKRSVNLSEQIQEHFGMPLEKSEDVRCSDWSRALNYRQVQCEFLPTNHFKWIYTNVSLLDAATDPYACLCLFNALEQKREAMDPVPPRPAHAELNQPIIIPGGNAVCSEEKESAASDPIEDDVAERS